MIFTVNVFADSVCVVFASPLTLLFALFCEHVSKTPEMFACSQIICDFRHAWRGGGWGCASSHHGCRIRLGKTVAGQNNYLLLKSFNTRKQSDSLAQ